MKDRNLTRPIELIVATSDGGDNGFWYTVDVDIPVKCDNDIDRQRTAFIAFWETHNECNYVSYIGVFAIPDENDDWSEYGYDENED